MAAKPKHKQSIIDTAVTLFRRQGYSRTGLNEICDTSGAPKGSVYHYFPRGKSSIAVAAVQEAGRRVVETCRELAADADSTAELIDRHARLLAGWMKKSGYRDGCPITTVLLELAPRERLVTRAGHQAYEARVDVVAKKLVADGFAPTRAHSLAVLCVSALQGALIQSRVDRSGAPLTTTAAELGRLIDAERAR